jgi:hypothetical protein
LIDWNVRKSSALKNWSFGAQDSEK